MVVNIKLTVGGTTYSEFLQMDVDKNIGDFNATSNFTTEFNNFTGILKDSFSLNDEVIIYSDLDTDPPTTKIFTGVIENINPSGEANNERITITGRDYGAVLQDMTVQPIVFKNQDAGEIAKAIVDANALGVVTTNNVDIATGTIVEKISFNHKNIFDALQELAELAGYFFYVDNDKDVHFEAKNGTSSGLTFDNTNVTNANFVTKDNEIFNKVWVYGDRILTGMSDTFGTEGGAVTGSTFRLTDKPHNTRVSVSDVLQEKGGIYQMDDPATNADLKYLVDFSEKKIIFVSGTAAGDNIPTSGTLPIQVDYERSTPILKFRQDVDSITAYGPKTKVIADREIKDYAQASEKATAFLAENKDPKIMGDLDIKGVIDVTPGATAVVDLPWHNIDEQTYTMISASYSFNKVNNLSEKVLHITVNKKVFDFTDTIKDHELRLRKVEAGPLEGDMTRLETFAGNLVVGRHYEVYAKNVGDNFIFHSAKHGLFNDPNSRIGTSRDDLGSTLLTSGGDF